MYDETEARLACGQQLLLHSDGIAEAHDPARDMFGIPRFRQVLAEHDGGPRLIQQVLDSLASFTGPDWEQEDDITLVSLAWDSVPDAASRSRALVAFQVPSEPGREREAMERVSDAVAGLGMNPTRLNQLRTAVAEATMNAIEHGNNNRPDLPVEISASIERGDLVVRITDVGGDAEHAPAVTPDLSAKLAGEQSLFLIEHMVDELRFSGTGDRHTAELVIHLEGEPHG